MAFQIDDRSLWGNEAADDEDPEVLSSYFVNRRDWDQFFDLGSRLSIARARKGMGKSALLSEFAFRFRSQKDVMIVSIKGADLVAQRDLRQLMPIEYIHDWQQRICSIINRHLASRIGFAFTDDTMTLVENAELAGFKSKNLFGALLDRFGGKVNPVDVRRKSIVNDKAIMLRQLASEQEQVILLVDDIDATFIDSDDEKTRLAAFFSACRDLAASYKGIIIRTVVRSDVWASISKKDEALDKVEQYIFDIKWSAKEFKRFIKERIVSYCKRSGHEGLLEGRSDEEVSQLVFSARFPWGSKGQAEPHRVIHLFSAGRPRWAAQLCRMAGSEAVKSGTSTVIKLGHFNQVLEKYGQYRVDDLVREHQHQCIDIIAIVESFRNGKKIFTSDELIGFLNTIVATKELKIDGTIAEDPSTIARFLHRIGFLSAVEEKYGQPKYYDFEEQPELWHAGAPIHGEIQWSVHPSFRAVLGLRWGKESV